MPTAAEQVVSPAGKLTVLTFVRHYLPGYKCGPIRSIANLVGALGAVLDFRIMTLDRDVGDTGPYPDVAPDGRWHAVGDAQVLYLSPAQRSLSNISRILRDTPHDGLYLNSAFDPVFAIRPLVARRIGLAPKMPCLIAPRGEFSPGALRLKAWKKRSFLNVARVTGLYNGLTWQASSEIEKREIKNALGATANDIDVAPNVAARLTPGDATSPRRAGEALRVCFLSRISPKKNLHFALDVLRHVQVPIRFDIYGPVEDERYWSDCQRAIGELPSTVAGTYCGIVEHNKVPTLLAAYDLFLLPTFGENYGHVIYEALAAGTPVLIADTTPWRNLAASGAGWDLPLDNPKAFREIIEMMAHLPPEEHSKMRMQARSAADKREADASVVDANLRLFARTFAERNR